MYFTLGREARLRHGGQSLGAGPEGPDHLRIDDRGLRTENKSDEKCEPGDMPRVECSLKRGHQKEVGGSVP